MRKPKRIVGPFSPDDLVETPDGQKYLCISVNPVARKIRWFTACKKCKTGFEFMTKFRYMRAMRKFCDEHYRPHRNIGET